jgi:hypothetical protein
MAFAPFAQGTKEYMIPFVRAKAEFHTIIMAQMVFSEQDLGGNPVQCMRQICQGTKKALEKQEILVWRDILPTTSQRPTPSSLMRYSQISQLDACFP